MRIILHMRSLYNNSASSAEIRKRKWVRGLKKLNGVLIEFIADAFDIAEKFLVSLVGT